MSLWAVLTENIRDSFGLLICAEQSQGGGKPGVGQKVYEGSEHQLPVLSPWVACQEP